MVSCQHGTTRDSRDRPACSGVGSGMADHRAHLTLAALTHHATPLTAGHCGCLSAPVTHSKSSKWICGYRHVGNVSLKAMIRSKPSQLSSRQICIDRLIPIAKTLHAILGMNLNMGNSFGASKGKVVPLSKATGVGSGLVLGHTLAWPLCKQAAAAKLILDQQAHTFQ